VETLENHGLPTFAKGSGGIEQKHVNMIHEQMPFFDLRFLLSREPTKNRAQRVPQFLIQNFCADTSE
jgi:hypothetical protein